MRAPDEIATMLHVSRSRSRLVAIVFALTLASPAPCAREDDASRSVPRQPVDVDWQTSPLDLDLRGMNGERYLFHCPPGKPLASRVIGSGPYTDDSSICSAAVHAGAIHAKDGGDVSIEIRPGKAQYAGSERNYIRSAAYDHAWSGSFVVLRDGTAPTP